MNFSLKHPILLRSAALLSAGTIAICGFAASVDVKPPSIAAPQSSSPVAQAAAPVKQSDDVVEAYRVCETFEHILGENLDFDRAYEATFPRSAALRRAIAIADGEIGERLAGVDDELIVKAYKRRMQLTYFLLPLAGPSDEEAPVFFPAAIKQLLERQPPDDQKDFPAYVVQLDRDVAQFRAHLDSLSAHNPAAADRIREFKSAALAAKFQPPADRKIEPSYEYYRTSVLKKDEPYYEISGYTVAKEQGKMRIVGIRFITRLF
jgi:hypothetical protein